MADEEYAELLEYEAVTGEAPQYYIDPRLLGDYIDLTNINLDDLTDVELPGEREGLVRSVEQEGDHESIRVKSEPLSEEGIVDARTNPVEVKQEASSDDGVEEEEWVDVLRPTVARKSPEIKQESQHECEAEYIPTPPEPTTPPQATMPWTNPEGSFVYYPPSPPATEPMDEDEDEEENVFDNAVRELQYRIYHSIKDHAEDDIEMPDAEYEVEEVDDIDTEMGGLEEKAEDKSSMDCTPDFRPIERALLHPDIISKLKAARRRRFPACRRTPSNDSLSTTRSSCSRRSPKRVQKQITDVFRKTLHKIREFSVERVAMQASPSGQGTRSPSDFVDWNRPYSAPTPPKTHQAVKRRHKIGKKRWSSRIETLSNAAACVSVLDPVYFSVVRF